MVATIQEKLYTPEEYLAIEREAPYKSEYLYGEIFAMAGASRNHNRIQVNLARELSTQLKGKHSEALPSDMRVEANEGNQYTYPDISVVCGEAEFYDEQEDVLKNPTVLIEILSPSTERHDRGPKFTNYQAIPTLLEYVMVSQDKPRVEVYERQKNDKWLLTIYMGIDTVVPLNSIQCELHLREVYDRVRFEAKLPTNSNTKANGNAN